MDGPGSVKQGGSSKKRQRAEGIDPLPSALCPLPSSYGAQLPFKHRSPVGQSQLFEHCGVVFGKQ